MQNEKIDLPDKLEDMQLLLLTYREELIHAKVWDKHNCFRCQSVLRQSRFDLNVLFMLLQVAKEHYEEQLKSEVNFLKSQLLGEQQAKESIEDQLTSEMEALREKVPKQFLILICTLHALKILGVKKWYNYNYKYLQILCLCYAC